MLALSKHLPQIPRSAEAADLPRGRAPPKPAPRRQDRAHPRHWTRRRRDRPQAEARVRHDDHRRQQRRSASRALRHEPARSTGSTRRCPTGRLRDLHERPGQGHEAHDRRAANRADEAQSAFLINPSRGSLIVEEDLIAALKAGRIAGAALDSYEVEPLPADSPLWELDNVILTPHVSGGRPGYNTAVIDKLLANLDYFRAGQSTG